jgi:hypothetical protein
MSTIRQIRRLGVISAVLAAAGCIPAGPNSEVGSSGTPGFAFPDVVGINLHGEEIALPAGFAGRLNLIAVAFEQSQQPDVDTWIAAAEGLLPQHDGLRFYEVPTIYQANPVLRAWVNNGMRAGIRDSQARTRTITVYVDRQRFIDALAIPDMDDIDMFLIDRAGKILWHARGALEAETLASLERVLDAASAFEGTSTIEAAPST